MSLGTLNEPQVREWFKTSVYLPKGYTVVEVGIAVPKFDTRIGASVDGLILDEKGIPVAILEIKCPRRVYTELKGNLGGIRCLREKDPLRNHIKRDHYSQMQGGMAIIDVDLCYYIVYGHEEKKIHVEKVPRNKEYWSRDLYPAICCYIYEKFFPRNVVATCK